MNGNERTSRGEKVGLWGIGLFIICIPLIMSAPYYLHVLILIGIFSIVAMGVFVQLKAGLVSLGSAVYWGLGAYASALIGLKVGLNFWLCLPLAGVISAVVALIVGVLIVRMGNVGFLMLTVVINGIFVELLGRSDYFGGWDGLTGIRRPSLFIPFWGSLEFVTKSAYYYVLIFLVLFTVVCFYRLYHSRIGTAWTAVGLNARLTSSMGINVLRYKLASYVIAAFFSGLAGSFYAHYQGFLVPRTFDIWPSVLLLMYPIVGGLEYSIAGPIAGTFLLVILPEILRITQLYEPVFFGLILVFTVLFLHGGVLSLPTKVYLMAKSVSQSHRDSS